MQKGTNKVVIFDLDDTLMPNQYLYYEKKEVFKEDMIKLFGDEIDHESILATYNDIDLENIKEMSFKRIRVPCTMVETYMHYCKETNNAVDIRKIKDVFGIGSSIFDTVPPLFEGAEDTIKNIKKVGYQVYILTAGDELVQISKIYKNGLHKLIGEENIIITPMHKEQALRENFEKFGFENCVMIGNSEKSDINPALRVGMNAIYIPEAIPDDKKWGFFHEELKDDHKLHRAKNISEVPELLNKVFTKQDKDICWTKRLLSNIGGISKVRTNNF